MEPVTTYSPVKTDFLEKAQLELPKLRASSNRSNNSRPGSKRGMLAPSTSSLFSNYKIRSHPSSDQYRSSINNIVYKDKPDDSLFSKNLYHSKDNTQKILNYTTAKLLRSKTRRESLKLSAEILLLLLFGSNSEKASSRTGLNDHITKEGY